MTNVGGPAAESTATVSTQQESPATSSYVTADGDTAAPPAGAHPAGYPYPAYADGQYPGVVYEPVEPDRFTRFFTRLYTRSPRWAAPVAALACMAAGVGYTLLVDPTRSSADAIPTCLLKMTTGLDCPGCGGTRAMWYVLHGDLPAAARHHLLFVFVLPFLLYLYVAWAVQHMSGRRLPQLPVSNKTIGVVLAVWMVFSVARNVPWAPFTWFYV
ncbi:hypothetical protein GCM10027280_03000 [Micromonospora polyrhachis]|uniref:DUF2752 domain-containing protein n=1 Tax=Micromonospora polyrhachis TaxID=1282883 RepID=A0A7W7SMC4_9ACTN|nr:DUF2752 domain-containing protein [Micromonospora polyrhachis]MBB4957403.1 hypothetical protein [Micromonospora polyrhachis]